MFACIAVLVSIRCAVAQTFSFDNITYWIGSGSNRAAIVIDWADDSPEPSALAWGYRWNGTAHGNDMLTAIVAADPRLFAKLGGSQANPATYGLGYDTDGDGEFGINDDTQFDSLGFAFSDPADLATATDFGDYYAEGWFAGFWHYGVASANPYNGGSWSDTGAGMASRTLTDGAWDSWTFSPSFDFASFAKSPIAAEPPFPPGDFNCDGRVDTADYAVWRSNFGSTSQPAADANGNGIVDAADYVVWRQNFPAAGTANGQVAINAPEPNFALLIVLLLTKLTIQRKPLMNANRR